MTDEEVNPASTDTTNMTESNVLYVRGLPHHVRDDHLQELFSTYGHVQSAQIMRDPHTKESRGFAFINMTDSNSAEAAITGLSGKDYEGRVMVVERARRGKPREPTPGRFAGRNAGGRMNSDSYRRDNRDNRDSRDNRSYDRNNDRPRRSVDRYESNRQSNRTDSYRSNDRHASDSRRTDRYVREEKPGFNDDRRYVRASGRSRSPRRS